LAIFNRQVVVSQKRCEIGLRFSFSLSKHVYGSNIERTRYKLSQNNNGVVYSNSVAVRCSDVKRH